MASVIILTGASGCGKSEIIRILKEIGNEEKYYGVFNPVIISKYTTRKFRSLELEKISKNRQADLDIRPVFGKDNIVLDEQGIPLSDDKQNQERMRLFANLKCDMVYEQYGNRYGIYLSDLYDNIKHGKSPVIILNDIRTVEDLKTFLGDKCISLFVFRKSPKMEEYIKRGELRNSDYDDAIIRYNKANSIYRIYIENIHIFDKLILNIQNGDESLNKILHQLVDTLCNYPTDFYYVGGI